MDRLGKALERVFAEGLKFKQRAEKLPGARCNDDAVGRSEVLQARCQVGRLADYGELARVSFSGEVGRQH
jgi:hypothetical protein